MLSTIWLNKTRQRLAYCFANLHAETGDFTIKNLTENINYTAARMAAVWPSRFANAAAVQAKYGTALGRQQKAFDVLVRTFPVPKYRGRHKATASR